jgi:hypothetical protein
MMPEFPFFDMNNWAIEGWNTCPAPTFTQKDPVIYEIDGPKGPSYVLLFVFVVKDYFFPR